MARGTPAWLRSAALYQIFVRNFTPEGTFGAAATRLKEIRGLGFDIVYLTPIHPVGALGRKGPLGSPYAISDYRSVDPGLGTLEDARRFLDAAHGEGLRVIMDVVFNHTSLDSVLLSEHPQWFLRDGQGRPSRKVADWSDVCDLDFSHRGLREYLLETLSFWADAGFDGFRCDVASLVPLDFWVEARTRLNARRPLIWLAESVEAGFVKQLRDEGWEAASDTELHDAFDLTYEYDGFEHLARYFRGAEGLEAYLGHLGVQQTLYPAHAIKARFLENHDQPRAAALIRGRERLMSWTAFSMLLPGLIFMYMGQESAIEEKPDLFRKDPVRWDQGSDEFRAFIGTLLPLCKRIKAETAVFDLVRIAAGVLALRWRDRAGGFRCTTIVNLEGKAGTAALPFVLKGTDLLGGGAVDTACRMEIPRMLLIVREC
jgi:glycosidase